MKKVIIENFKKHWYRTSIDFYDRMVIQIILSKIQIQAVLNAENKHCV